MKQAQHRWYDLDPTLSLSLNFLRNSSGDEQKRIAESIIEKAKNNKIILHETDLKQTDGLFNKRWYDEDKVMSLALLYLKRSSKDLRQKIALEIFDSLS